MMQAVFDTAVAALTALVVVVTLLPFSSSTRWWVRACDFPRVQVAALAVALIVAAWFVTPPLGWALIAALVPCALWQGWRIRPYTPLAAIEMGSIPPIDDGQQVTLLSVNVEMINDRYEDVGAVIDGEDPDVLFLMETDETWYVRLAHRIERYPTVRTALQDNYYGLVFATRLPVRRCEIVHLTPDETPAVYAELESPSGRVFRFVGLHPRPPVPGEDTKDRDAELLLAARFAWHEGVPLVSMGDFNDAAWSDTSRRFKHAGAYLDPRVGRGLIPSFDAKSWFLRAPIDQFFATREVGLVEFRRGPHVGSDHFPIIARIDLDPGRVARVNAEPNQLTDAEAAEVEEILDDYRKRMPRDLPRF